MGDRAKCRTEVGLCDFFFGGVPRACINLLIVAGLLRSAAYVLDVVLVARSRLIPIPFFLVSFLCPYHRSMLAANPGIQE